MSSNAAVEGSEDHAEQATRAHTHPSRPRRYTVHASRPLQRLSGALSHSDKVWDSNKRQSQYDQQNGVGDEIREDH
jgi:hypothetical protein